MAEERRRRRRRRVSSSLEPEEQKPRVPAEEIKTKTESQREEKRITKAPVSRQRQSEMNLPSPTKLTEEKNQGVGKKGILVMRQGIDEIRAELGEERNSALLESDYWAPINLNK